MCLFTKDYGRDVSPILDWGLRQVAPGVSTTVATVDVIIGERGARLDCWLRRPAIGIGARALYIIVRAMISVRLSW